MELDKVAQPNSTPPKPPKRRLNRKAFAAVGGFCVVLFITVGVLLGSQTEQETNNGSRDILRMFETAPGIKITLQTTGIYADDGEFQQTDIVIAPKDFSKYTTELVFDAKAQFESGNSTFTHIIKDSKGYTIEEANGTTTAYCANVPEMPHLDTVIDAILYAQVIDEESDFRQALDCPGKSDRMIHTVWEDLDYFYCFDTNGGKLGSFLGPEMIGKIEYLSEVPSIEAPEDVECAAIELSEISKASEDIFDIEQSRRRLKAMTEESCDELVRLGQCSWCYSETFGGNTLSTVATWDMLMHSFDLIGAEPYASFPMPPTDIQVRRSLRRRGLSIRSMAEKVVDRTKKIVEKSVMIVKSIFKYQHPGLRCIFMHGAGVSSPEPRWRTEMDWYWGKHTRSSRPPYCKSVDYIQVNTRTRSYKDTGLLNEVALLLKKFGRWGRVELSEVALITHGTGGMILAEAISRNKVKLTDTAVWLALNVPQHGSTLTKYHRNNCKHKTSLKTLLLSLSENSGVSLTCGNLDLAGYSIPALQGKTLKNYQKMVTMAMCGASASSTKSTQGSFTAATIEDRTEDDFMNLMTDGMTRLGDCLETENGKMDSRYTVLASSYWKSQMRTGSSISKKGSVARWLYVDARKAVEPLVNGKTQLLARAGKLIQTISS